MEENIEHDHEEFEEAPVKPLWEVVYWDDKDEQIKTINVFGCCVFCAVTQATDYLDDELGENNWNVIKIEQMINVNIVNIEFAQYEEDEDDCEINAGLIEGDQGDGFFCKKCGSCGLMNKFPVGMTSFICSRCKTQNTL